MKEAIPLSDYIVIEVDHDKQYCELKNHSRYQFKMKKLDNGFIVMDLGDINKHVWQEVQRELKVLSDMSDILTYCRYKLEKSGEGDKLISQKLTPLIEKARSLVALETRKD